MLKIDRSWEETTGGEEEEEAADPTATEDRAAGMVQQEAAETAEINVIMQITTGGAAITTRTPRSGAVAATRIIGPGPISLPL
jgi:hypothetical protein